MSRKRTAAAPHGAPRTKAQRVSMTSIPNDKKDPNIADLDDLRPHPFLSTLAQMPQFPQDTLGHLLELEPSFLQELVLEKPFVEVIEENGKLYVIRNWHMVRILRAKGIKDMRIDRRPPIKHLEEAIWLELQTGRRGSFNQKTMESKTHMNQCLIDIKSPLLVGSEKTKLRNFQPPSSGYSMTPEKKPGMPTQPPLVETAEVSSSKDSAASIQQQAKSRSKDKAAIKPDELNGASKMSEDTLHEIGHDGRASTASPVSTKANNAPQPHSAGNGSVHEQLSLF